MIPQLKQPWNLKWRVTTAVATPGPSGIHVLQGGRGRETRAHSAHYPHRGPGDVSPGLASRSLARGHRSQLGHLLAVPKRAGLDLPTAVGGGRVARSPFRGEILLSALCALMGDGGEQITSNQGFLYNKIICNDIKSPSFP